MAELTLREYVVAEVKPLLPAGWRFIPNQATPDKISVVTVVLKHLEIEPSPAAAVKVEVFTACHEVPPDTSAKDN